MRTVLCNRKFSLLASVFALSLAGCNSGSAAAGAVAPLPDPPASAPGGATSEQVAVLAGGCFWGVEAVFEHVKGVKSVTSGYAGGSALTANYPLVSSGATRHAEAVRIVFDPKVIGYGELLRIFFAVAHDPTQLDRQGPDRGPQYRSAIFATGPEQSDIAKAYIAELGKAKSFDRPIVTVVQPLEKFFEGEDYHQDYARLNPTQPYIVFHDAPKVVALESRFPTLYRDQK